MTQRTDHQFYEFDIFEHESGETKRVPFFAYWSGEASIAERRRMCDCQLGAFFNAHPDDLNTLDKIAKGSVTNFFAGAQYKYLKAHKCDHAPSKKFTVARAYVDGDVIEIAA